MPSPWMSLPWLNTRGTDDTAASTQMWDGVPLLSTSVERSRQVMVWGVALGLSLGVSWLTWQWRWQESVQQLQQAGAAQLAGHAAALGQMFERNLALPRLLALDPKLHALLGEPTSAAMQLVVNQHLAEVSQTARVQVVYVLDAQGQVLATSNWQTPSSFLGRNYSFRPYFQQAMAGGVGMLYAVGTVTHEPGLFVAQPVRRPGANPEQVLGVVVVKLDLTGVEHTWAKQTDVHVALADDLGVLLLSSEPSWRYSSLAPRSQEDKQALAATQRYGRQLITPLSLGADVPVAASAVLDVPTARGEPATSLMQSQALLPWGWHLLLFSELQPARRAAALEAAVAGLLSALSMAALGVWRMQSSRRTEHQALASVLERMQAQLEHNVAERTLALTQTNQALQAQVRQLDARQQQGLENASLEAHPSNPLLVLSQMAAGLSDELNPPLNALLSCVGEVVDQLEQGGQAQLRENLDVMLALAERLGRVMGQLKAFARPAALQMQVVPVAQALGTVMTLLAPELRSSGLGLQTYIADGATRVLADPIRLEQVLLCLLRNALEAGVQAAGGGTSANADATLEVHVWRDGERIHLRVRDHGSGLHGDASLVGLNLARAAAQSMGGELHATSLASADSPGSAFTLSLRAAA